MARPYRWLSMRSKNKTAISLGLLSDTNSSFLFIFGIARGAPCRRVLLSSKLSYYIKVNYFINNRLLCVVPSA